MENPVVPRGPRHPNAIACRPGDWPRVVSCRRRPPLPKWRLLRRTRRPGPKTLNIRHHHLPLRLYSSAPARNPPEASRRLQAPTPANPSRRLTCRWMPRSTHPSMRRPLITTASLRLRLASSRWKLRRRLLQPWWWKHWPSLSRSRRCQPRLSQRRLRCQPGSSQRRLRLALTLTLLWHIEFRSSPPMRSLWWTSDSRCLSPWKEKTYQGRRPRNRQKQLLRRLMRWHQFQSTSTPSLIRTRWRTWRTLVTRSWKMLPTSPVPNHFPRTLRLKLLKNPSRCLRRRHHQWLSRRASRRFMKHRSANRHPMKNLKSLSHHTHR